MTIRIVSVLVLSLGFAAASVPAFAGEVQKVSADVRFGDLNLVSEQGVSTLHRRIEVAAEKVCGRPDIRDIKASSAAAACRSNAIAAAKPGVELAIANARNGQAYAANQASLKVNAR